MKDCPRSGPNAVQGRSDSFAKGKRIGGVQRGIPSGLRRTLKKSVLSYGL